MKNRDKMDSENTYHCPHHPETCGDPNCPIH